MIKLTYSILMSSNIFFYNLLYIYKTSKDSSARYYQNNKDYKKYLERYESLSQEEKGKKVTMWLWTTQESTRRGKKRLMEKYWKNIIKWEKTPFTNYKKLSFKTVMT